MNALNRLVLAAALGAVPMLTGCCRTMAAPDLSGLDRATARVEAAATRAELAADKATAAADETHADAERARRMFDKAITKGGR
jgi:hypothetical protein